MSIDDFEDDVIFSNLEETHSAILPANSSRTISYAEDASGIVGVGFDEEECEGASEEKNNQVPSDENCDYKGNSFVDCGNENSVTNTSNVMHTRRDGSNATYSNRDGSDVTNTHRDGINVMRMTNTNLDGSSVTYLNNDVSNAPITDRGGRKEKRTGKEGMGSGKPQEDLFDSDLDADTEYKEKIISEKKKTSKPISQDLKEIETLKFETYVIRTKGTEYICRKIESAYLLKHVDLSNCGLNKIMKIGDLFQAVFERYCLETLNISKNYLLDKTSEFIAKGIQETTSLLELDISKNCFGDKAAQCIGTAMGKNQSITKLNISWNEIRNKSAVKFIKSMMRNKTLLCLDVSWNGFGYEGALATSEFLKKNKNLQYLNLANNRIDWKAAALIADGLAKNQTLRKLELDENPLTTNGCMDIIDAIDSNKNSSLVYLGLKKVPVISDFQMAVDYIGNKKEFVVEHGGIVGSHDVLGYKSEKRVIAIEKVVDFMKEKKMRKTEFFRLLDINTEGNMNPEKLRGRLKKTNVGLPDHEIDELISFLLDDNNTNSNIDFKKLADGVKDFKDKQRLEKINVVEEKTKIKELHEKILEI